MLVCRLHKRPWYDAHSLTSSGTDVCSGMLCARCHRVMVVYVLHMVQVYPCLPCRFPRLPLNMWRYHPQTHLVSWDP